MAINKGIRCAMEGDDVVVRIPFDCHSKVVVGIEGVAGCFQSGYVIRSGRLVRQTPEEALSPQRAWFEQRALEALDQSLSKLTASGLQKSTASPGVAIEPRPTPLEWEPLPAS